MRVQITNRVQITKIIALYAIQLFIRKIVILYDYYYYYYYYRNYFLYNIHCTSVIYRVFGNIPNKILCDLQERERVNFKKMVHVHVYTNMAVQRDPLTIDKQCCIYKSCIYPMSTQSDQCQPPMYGQPLALFKCMNNNSNSRTNATTTCTCIHVHLYMYSKLMKCTCTHTCNCVYICIYKTV